MSEKALPLPPSRQTLTDSVYEAVMVLVVARQLHVSPTPAHINHSGGGALRERA